MAQPPEPTTTHVPALSRPLRYVAMLPPGFVFQPKGRCLIDRYLVPRALHGRVPDDAVQDAIAEGVDVCAVRPEALPFPSRSRSRGRGQFDGRGQAWGYFLTTRPAAAGGFGVAGGDRDDVRDVAAGGCWRRYGREKAYFGGDGGVIAFRRRFAFHEAADGGRKTPWRMKEFRLNEGAARFRGVTFQTSAKDLVICKVYNEVEIPVEEPAVEYYSSSDDDGYNKQAKRFKVGDAIAGPAANAA